MMLHSLMPTPEIHELHLLWNSENSHTCTNIYSQFWHCSSMQI